MFTVLDFLNVYGQKIRDAYVNDCYSSYGYEDSSVLYNSENDKLVIQIYTHKTDLYYLHSLTYDECMDWVVIYSKGNDCAPKRTHYKRVSSGNDPVITKEILTQLKILHEIMKIDHKTILFQREMKNGRI